jgi:hypothetical protein
LISCWANITRLGILSSSSATVASDDEHIRLPAKYVFA